LHDLGGPRRTVEWAERLGSLGFAVTYGVLRAWTLFRGGRAYLDHPLELGAIGREAPGG